MRRKITAKFLGRVPYGEALALQEELVTKRIAGDVGDTILFLEHPAVITLGRGADHANIVASKDSLAELGIEVHETGRGGDVTYHAPGQLVAYPIFDLKPDRCDVRKYVRDLCEVMIRLAADFDIDAGMIPNDPKKLGVWVNLDSPKKFDGEDAQGLGLDLSRKSIGKIGAVGVRLSRWVTMHGIAFNAATDLRGFSLIVPCGIRDHGVSSLASLGVDPPSIEVLARKALGHFENIFDADAVFEMQLSRAAAVAS
jgi:lipoyl(octanoyl) transferase